MTSPPFPLPTKVSQPASQSPSTNHSASVTSATKLGGKRQYGGYNAPVVQTSYNSVSGVGPQDTATNQSITATNASVQRSNDNGYGSPYWGQSSTTPATTTPATTTSGGSRRKSRKIRKSRKSRKSIKSRKSKRIKHKRRNTYKK